MEELVRVQEQAQWRLEKAKVGYPTESHHVMARVAHFQELEKKYIPGTEARSDAEGAPRPPERPRCRGNSLHDDGRRDLRSVVREGSWGARATRSSTSRIPRTAVKTWSGSVPPRIGSATGSASLCSSSSRRSQPNSGREGDV